MAATTDPASPQAPAPPTGRDRRATARIVALVLLIAVVGGALGWRWWSDRGQRIDLGDRGEVTAEVHPDCASMTIRIGDEVYADSGEIPPAWRGQQIVGRLHLDEGDAPQPFGDDGDETSARASGRFIAEGQTVEVQGGRNVFFTLACGIWAER